MENLKQLEKIAKIFQPQNIITSDEIDQVLKGILEILATYKKSTESINQDTKLAVNELYSKIVELNKTTLSSSKEIVDSRVSELETLLGDVKQMISDVETMASEIKDGKDADEEKIVEDVVNRIKIDPTVITMSAEEVRDKLASLKDENRLDKSAIKGLDKILQQSDLDYAIATLQQQTSFLINRGGIKSVVAGTNITVDNTDPSNPIISSTGGGSPGGSTTQLQYNNAGAFGGISGATTNGTAVTFTANNLIAADITASGSGGLLLQANSGTDVLLLGAGGGSNATFYGGVNVTGDLTVDTNVLDVDTTNNRIGINTSAPGYDLTLGLGNGTGIAIHRLADETTNYEVFRSFWSGTTLLIRTEKAGTGTERPISIRQGTTGGVINMNSASPWISLGLLASKSTASLIITETASGTLTASSGTQTGTSVAPTINQSSTAGYTALLVNPTETTTGSGTKTLIDVQVGGSSKFNVLNTGVSTHTNSVDAASNQVLVLKGARATPATSDEIYQSFFLNNGSGTSVEVARITTRETTITAGSEASELRFTVRASGSLPTNPHLFLNSARLSPFTNDGLALGATGTSWADLFLATGGVINWNNGNATLTHSTGLLTSNVPIATTQIYNADLAATVTTNSATITRASRNNTFTNSSAASMTITLSTTGATAGDMLLVQIYDFSAVAQTITWVNTENSDVLAPTTSNGSTTLPRTAGFKWNPSTSKWRCMMNV